MDVRVSLPKPNDTSGQEIKSFLRQLELSVHHLQKTIEEMEKDAPLDENTYIMYSFPKIDLYKRESDDKGFVKVHVDEEFDQMQEIEVEITTM